VGWNSTDTELEDITDENFVACGGIYRQKFAMG